MLLNMTIKEFLEQIDSSSTTPGGGCVSALLGALGASLARMYGHVSIHKKAFGALRDDVKETFLATFENLSTIKDRLGELMDLDIIHYQKLMVAYKLKKDTLEELQYRDEQIHQATIGAIEPPLAMMKEALMGMQYAVTLAPYGNKNAQSDLLVGINCLYAALLGGYENVRINCAGLSKEEQAIYEKEINLIKEKATDLLGKIQ